MLKKLTTFLAIGLISFGSLGLFGCAPPNQNRTNSQEAALLGLIVEGAAINNPDLTPQQRATAGAVAGHLYNRADHEAMKEAAREGRTEVNINTSQGGDYFIVVNKATGESKRVEGRHEDLYARMIVEKKSLEYPEGFIIFIYRNDVGFLGTSEWDGKTKRVGNFNTIKKEGYY